MKNLSIEEEIKIIQKNTVDLLPMEELVAKLKRSREKGIPLRIKYGADPSRPDLHLGHYVCLKKLKDLQDLGHQIVFIVGDFTAMIGDPSGKSKTRPRLSEEEVKEHARTYFEQVYMVLDPEKTEVTYNSKWLGALTSKDVIELAATYTVARMLERDDFKMRFEKEIPIFIHELLYPLFQGYDSYAISSDIEVGGTDQKFNFVIARDIQKYYGQEPQVILTVPLIEGTDGKLKMSKSYDNYIALKDSPEDMYGKVMSIPDDLILKYFKLVLYYDDDELKKVEKLVKENPRDAKARLAFEIVQLFHGYEKAKRAEEHFNRVFRQKEIPDNIPVYKLDSEGELLIDILHKAGVVPSKSEARRLIRQGGVKINGEPVTNETLEIKKLSEPIVVKVGKRRFLKITPE